MIFEALPFGGAFCLVATSYFEKIARRVIIAPGIPNSEIGIQLISELKKE